MRSSTSAPRRCLSRCCSTSSSTWPAWRASITSAWAPISTARLSCPKAPPTCPATRTSREACSHAAGPRATCASCSERTPCASSRERRPERGTMARAKRPSAHEQMRALIGGYWVSQLLFAVARLGVADVLVKGPRSPEAIAQQVGAKAPQLRRVLRALASVGVFAEDAKRRFKLTPLADTLRSDRPGSLRDFAQMLVQDYNWEAWGALLHGVVTDERPFDHVHGKPAFAYLAEHPEKEAV